MNESLPLICTLILFAITMYSQDTSNAIAVNVMIGLAIVHFSLVITYHIFTYVLSRMTRNKLQLHFTALIGWIKRKKAFNPAKWMTKFSEEYNTRSHLPVLQPISRTFGIPWLDFLLQCIKHCLVYSYSLVMQMHTLIYSIVIVWSKVVHCTFFSYRYCAESDYRLKN